MGAYASASNPDDVSGLHPGVLPLVISSGAGSGAQNAVGTGVMGGMITATVLAIFFVPVFFVVVRRRFSKKNEDRNTAIR